MVYDHILNKQIMRKVITLKERLMHHIEGIDPSAFIDKTLS